MLFQELSKTPLMLRQEGSVARVSPLAHQVYFFIKTFLSFFLRQTVQNGSPALPVIDRRRRRVEVESAYK